MEFKHLFGHQENNKFHPSWILLIVALTILVGGVVWSVTWLVSNNDRSTSDRTPSTTPEGPRVIMVANSVRTVQHS